MMAPSYLFRGFLWVSQILLLLLLLLFPSCVPSDSDDNSRLEIEESTGEVRALLDRTLTTEYLSLLERYPYEGFTLLMALSVNDLFPQLTTNESHWNLSVKWFRFCGLKGHVNPTVKHDLTSHYSTLNLNNIPFKVLDRPNKGQIGGFHSDIDQRDYEVVVKIFRREMERFDLEYDHHLYDNYTMDDVNSFGQLDIDAKYARMVELMMTVLPKWKKILVEWMFMEHVTLPKLLNPICINRSQLLPSNNATTNESYSQNPRIDSTSHLTDYFNHICSLFSTLSLNVSKLVESPPEWLYNRAIAIPGEFRSFMGEVVAPSIPIKSHKFLYRDAITWLYKDYVKWYHGGHDKLTDLHKLTEQVVLYLTLLQPEKMNHIREQSAISTSTVLLIVLIIVLAVLVVIALFCIGAELVARYRKQQTMEIHFQLE